ncbi:hypothetical protein BDV98DRAFT_567676 [Pterulicium gracile]|uniref:Uncharacterized protein n=1 Tax=Pterulicium gracile TaxID=1884261 RepID=A0A5C3QGP1_9AGAR|nr:hypothetical protein BDV98DRAFT_567676 [Pterula gracilis]
MKCCRTVYCLEHISNVRLAFISICTVTSLVFPFHRWWWWPALHLPVMASRPPIP